MRELKKRLAKILIERSYREGDFTLASGRKSDYYFDCRQTALHPKGRGSSVRCSTSCWPIWTSRASAA